MEKEVKPIDLENVLVACKLSLLEYDMRKYKLSEQEILERYERIGADKDNILNSHIRQLESRREVLRYLPNARVFVGEVLNDSILKRFPLVVALGGDNYFQYVSHFLDKQLIVGINSDQKNSEGALLNFNCNDLENLIPKLKDGTYDIEKWTRLKANVNGKDIGALAVSEIFVGAKNRLDMSRYIIEVNGVKDENKDSGLLIATGAGSTGWYHSATGCEHYEAETYSKTLNVARFVSTENYIGKNHRSILTRGVIYPEDIISITWLAHGRGIVSLDCSSIDRMHYLNRGSKATIKISEKPLLVVKRIKESDNRQVENDDKNKKDELLLKIIKQERRAQEHLINVIYRGL